jgi:hypothetical protein
MISMSTAAYSVWVVSGIVALHFERVYFYKKRWIERPPATWGGLALTIGAHMAVALLGSLYAFRVLAAWNGSKACTEINDRSIRNRRED